MDLKTKCEIIVKEEQGKINWDSTGEFYSIDRTLKEIAEV